MKWDNQEVFQFFNVLKPLAKKDLIPLGIATAASAINVAIQKKMFEWSTTTLIVSNEEMNHIIKIVQFLEESGLLIKGVSKAIQNDAKEQKEVFPGMLLGTLGAYLLGNLLAGKGVMRAGEHSYSWSKCFMPPHPLTNSKIQNYYQNETKFNGVYSINNLSKVYDETYFDSFGVANISKEIKKFIGNKNILTNVSRIQAYDSIICRYFCFRFIDFMLKGQSLLDYRNLFSIKNMKKIKIKKNDQIILNYFQKLKIMFL